MRTSLCRRLRSNAWAWIPIVLGCISGCHSSYVEPTTVPSGIEELPILWQASGTYSRLTRAVRLVVRDPATLAQVPLCEVPVDFRSQMVLIPGLGPTARNDLGIRIQSVRQERSRIRVLERQIYPGDRPESGGPHPASPWTVVVVPLSSSSVEGYSTRLPRGLLLPGKAPH